MRTPLLAVPDFAVPVAAAFATPSTGSAVRASSSIALHLAPRPSGLHVEIRSNPARPLVVLVDGRRNTFRHSGTSTAMASSSVVAPRVAAAAVPAPAPMQARKPKPSNSSTGWTLAGPLASFTVISNPYGVGLRINNRAGDTYRSGIENRTGRPVATTDISGIPTGSLTLQ